jgi:uncharacterized protein (TIGR02284 family)
MTTLVGRQKNVVDALDGLIELGLDATEAYEVAVERIEDLDDKDALRSFRDDHERQVRELQSLVSELGGIPSTAPDFKRVLTKGKVALGSLVGDRLVLLALKSNEEDMLVAYGRLIAHADVTTHGRDLLRRGLEDERRHHAYFERRLIEFGTNDAESSEPLAPTERR